MSAKRASIVWWCGQMNLQFSHFTRRLAATKLVCFALPTQPTNEWVIHYTVQSDQVFAAYLNKSKSVWPPHTKWIHTRSNNKRKARRQAIRVRGASFSCGCLPCVRGRMRYTVRLLFTKQIEDAKTDNNTDSILKRTWSVHTFYEKTRVH